MEFLDYRKKRFLAFATLLLAGLGHINLFGVKDIISPIMNQQLVGDIMVSTVVGIATIAVVIALYYKKVG